MVDSRALHTLEAEAAQLPTGDWTAHRDLAQESVVAGFACEVTQTFDNDAFDTSPLTHELRFFDPADVVELEEGISEGEDAMGGSVSIEQFTSDRPHGFYGQRTPLEFSPVQEDDPTEYANIRLLRGQEESVHPTLTAALETVLRDQSELVWTSPAEHVEFDTHGPLDADNPAPLLISSDGGVRGEHLFDALRVAAATETERVVVATGRPDVGSVFKATFEPDGDWAFETASVNDGHRVAEGSGMIPASNVPGEFSDAFETKVEAHGRTSRADEHSNYENRQVTANDGVDAQAASSMAQVMKNRPPAGPRVSLTDAGSQTSHTTPNVNSSSSISRANDTHRTPPTHER